MKKIIIALCLLALPSMAYAHKLTVVYTGNSYSSLYPCGHCPASVGGGLSRRATVIGEIKAKNPNVLILDAGNFTAGGALDEASINPEMDQKRSQYTYEAMQMMGYDAVTLGEAEFNFGVDFLKENIKKFKLTPVSSNLEIEDVLPYYIKQFKSFKVGVIGLSPQILHKTKGLNVKDYQKTLASLETQLKGKVDFIVLLSSLGEQENFDLAKKFNDVKLILSSGNITNYASMEEKVNDTVIVKPSFLAKDVRVIDLDVKLNKIVSYKLNRVPLSLAVNENPKILKIIPVCFNDSNCSKREGLISSCQNPGTKESACAYFEPKKIEAITITDTDCKFCLTKFSEDIMKNVFLGLNFRAVDYKSQEGRDLITKYSITTLPAFILPEEIKTNKDFPNASSYFEEKSGNFLPKNEISGIFLFLNRKEIPNRIDLFLNPYDKKALEPLQGLSAFSSKHKITLNIYFILEKNNISGYPIEEIKIAYAVKKVFPDKFIKYLQTRISDIKTKSWIESLEASGIDYKKIKGVAESKEIEKTMDQNDEVAKNFNVTSGNVIVINNNRIFKVFQVNNEDLEGFFKKK